MNKSNQNNKFIDLATKRKTSYLFDSSKKINDKDLEIILEAGRISPSCQNSQPWKFIVIRDSKLISKLKDTIAYGRPPKNPPVIIALVFTPELTSNAPNCKVTDETGVTEGFMSIAMAALQMSLQATELGISTAFLSPKENLAKPLIDVNEKDRIPFLLMLGYEPDNAPKRPKVRKELKDIVKFI